MHKKVVSNFKNWLVATCPSFYKQNHLHDGDYELILEFGHIRNFNVRNYCLLMEMVCSGEFRVTMEMVDIISQSNLDFLKLMNVNDEVDDLISEDEAARTLGMKDAAEFRKSVTGRGYLTALELPDQPGKHFIKKHVLWHKEMRDFNKGGIKKHEATKAEILFCKQT